MIFLNIVKILCIIMIYQQKEIIMAINNPNITAFATNHLFLVNAALFTFLMVATEKSGVLREKNRARGLSYWGSR